jgi:hypothetical protein
MKYTIIEKIFNYINFDIIEYIVQDYLKIFSDRINSQNDITDEKNILKINLNNNYIEKINFNNF